MNDLNLSLFSDADLDALEKGDLSALSEEGLSILETRQAIISKGPKTRGGKRTPRVLPYSERRTPMRPDEYGERFGAEPELGPSPKQVKETAVSTGMGVLGGFPRMGAGVSSIFGENELSRQLREIEAGLRAGAPEKEVFDVAKYFPQVIPATATAKVISKIPMVSRTAKTATQATGQAATAAAVEPEDRVEAATVAGLTGVIPLGVRGVGMLREKFNEALTGGKADIVRDQLARVAESLGFKIQAGQVSRTAPVSTPGAGAAAESNQNLANQWASAPTGESTDKITGTFLSDRKAALGAVYDDIFQNRQFSIRGPDIRSFEQILELENSISPAHVPKLKEMVQNILKNYDEMSAKIARSGTQMPVEEGAEVFPFTIAGEGLQRLRNKLRLAASSSTDKSAAFEINKMVDRLDDIVKNTDPKLYEKLMDTNQKYRATSTLIDLEKKGDIPAGDISLERLGREVSGDQFNPLFPIGKIGQELGIRGLWEPEVSGVMRSAAGEARQMIRPGIARVIFNRLAMYPRSQAARNLQKKIIDAEATGGLGNISFSAEELAIINPILQSITAEEPQQKAKGGVVNSEDQAVIDEIRKLPWFNRYVKKFGEEPDLSSNADYDYITAYKSGARPDETDHWPSYTGSGIRLKRENHPTLWKTLFMDKTGIDPDSIGIKNEQEGQAFIQRQELLQKYYLQAKAKGGMVDSGEDYTKYNARIMRALIKRYGSEAKAREVMRVTDGGELLRIMREEESKSSYTPAEQDLLRRYDKGGTVKRPTLPADRSAGYKQKGEGDDRLLRFFEAAARELPDAIKQSVTSNADLASKYLKFKFGMMSPEEAMSVARMLPDSLKAMATNAIQFAKEAPRAVAEATPESAGRFTAQVLGAELADPTRIGRVAGAVTKPVMSQVVKPKGGEFIQKGRYSLEGTVNALKWKPNQTNKDAKEILSELESRYTPETIATLPNERAQFALNAIESAKENVALNDWVENKLARYVRNEMATPEDPIRKLAEEGILHVDPRNLNFSREMYGKYLLPDQTLLAKSDTAKSWEGASDLTIGHETAGEFANKFKDDSIIYDPKKGG